METEMEIDKELLDHKKKKWFYFIGIIGAFLIVAILSVELSDKTQDIEMTEIDNPIIETEITNVGLRGSNPSDSEIWLSSSEAQLKSMENEIASLKKMVENQDKQKSSVSLSADRTGLPSLPPAPIDRPAYIPNLGPTASSVVKVNNEPSLSVQPTVNDQQNMNQFAGFSTLRMTPPDDLASQESTYLTVSISPARLLTGVSAPTGGNAKNDPQPMLFEITDLSMLPNAFEQNFVGCFANGAGYGSLSSERVSSRITTLSCVSSDGQAIEVKVDGYVTGPDGGVGIKGKVDDKQGPLLAKALAAGVASGIGSAFAAAGSTVTTSALGAVTTVTPDKVLQTGGYSGVSTAMDKLADFYMDRVNDMYPTINIGAGIEVDIILKKGIDIKGWQGELND